LHLTLFEKGEVGRIVMIKQNRIANNQKRETERERKTNEIDLLQFSNIKQAVVF